MSIHVLSQISDQDLQTRRLGQKVDPFCNELFIQSVYDPESLSEARKEKEGEEEKEEEKEGEEGSEGEEEDAQEQTKQKDEFEEDLVSVYILYCTQIYNDYFCDKLYQLLYV